MTVASGAARRGRAPRAGRRDHQRRCGGGRAGSDGRPRRRAGRACGRPTRRGRGGGADDDGRASHDGPAAHRAVRQRAAPARTCRLVQAYLDHLAVERGVAANTLASYRRDLSRYVDYLDTAGVSVGGRRRRRPQVDRLPGLPAQGDDRPPAAVGHLGRPGGGRRARPAPLRPARRAGRGRRRPRGAPARAAPPAAQGDLGRRRRAAARRRRLSPDAAGRPRPGAARSCSTRTGARISEAVGLAVDDVDLAERTVLLTGKGGKQRRVPLGSFAARGASRPTWCRPGRRWPRPARGTPTLFLNARGGPLSRQSAWAVLRTAAERAGLGGRHLAAHPAALVRHPPDGGRRRRAGGAGAARATRR